MFKFITRILIIISSPVMSFLSLDNKLSKISFNIDKPISTCPEYLTPLKDNFNQEQGEFLIKKISSIFPQVDSISHIVLHNSDILINCILNNDLLPLEQKKDIILFFIKMSQHGDATGSHILQFYHNLVSCLL